jgi:hypothetical protein
MLNEEEKLRWYRGLFICSILLFSFITLFWILGDKSSRIAIPTGFASLLFVWTGYRETRRIKKIKNDELCNSQRIFKGL